MSNHACDPVQLRQWLLNWLADELKIAARDIRHDENLLNYGMDSVNAMMLVGDLEQRLGIRLPPTLVWDFPTVDGLVAHVTATDKMQQSQPTEQAPDPGGTTPIDKQRAEELLAKIDQLSEQEVAELLQQLQNE